MFNLFHKFSLSKFSSSKYFSISRIFRLKIFSKIFHQKMTKNTKEAKKSLKNNRMEHSRMIIAYKLEWPVAHFSCFKILDETSKF